MGNTKWIIVNGILLGCSGLNADEIVPKDVSTIHNGALANFNFKSLAISDSVVDINQYAFTGSTIGNLIISNKERKALSIIEQIFRGENKLKDSINKLTILYVDPFLDTLMPMAVSDIYRAVGKVIPIEFKRSLMLNSAITRIYIDGSMPVDVTLFDDSIDELVIANASEQVLDILKQLKKEKSDVFDSVGKIIADFNITNKDIFDIYCNMEAIVPLENAFSKEPMLGEGIAIYGDTAFIDNRENKVFYLLEKYLNGDKDVFASINTLVLLGNSLNLDEINGIYEILGHSVTIAVEDNNAYDRRRLVVDPLCSELDYDYYDDWGICDITLPQDLTVARGLKNNNIAALDLPYNLKRIEEHFLENSSLELLSFADSILSVGDGAFKGSVIKEINILAYNDRVVSVLQLLKDANPDIFNDLEHLVIIGSSLTDTLENDIFEVVGSSVKIEVFASLNETMLNIDDDEWHIIDGVLMEYRGEDSDIIIPYGVTEILPEVFASKNINSVYIPDSVQNIGSGAFYDNNLTKVYLSNNIKNVGRLAFGGNNIEELTVNDRLLMASYSMLDRNGAKYLKKLYINNTCGKVRKALEYFCTNYDLAALEEFYVCGMAVRDDYKDLLKETLKEHDLAKVILEHKNNFSQDNNEEACILSGSLNAKSDEYEIINGKLVKYLAYERNVLIPEGVLIISEGAFQDNGRVKNIKLPNHLRVIEDRAFLNNAIERLVIPDSVVQVGKQAFLGNPLNYLSVTTNMMDFYSEEESSFNMNFVTTLCIRNHGGDVYRLIKRLCSSQELFCLEEVIIADKKLSLTDSLKIKNFFKKKGKKVRLTYQKDAQKLDEGLDIFQDNEINELIWTINEVADMLHFEDKEAINNRIKAVLNKYVDELKKIEPSLSFEADVSLSFMADPKVVRKSLIGELENMIRLLNNHSLYAQIIVLIGEYKQILYDKNISSVVQDAKNVDDELKTIIAISNMHDNENIRERLEKILNDIESWASNLLARCLNLEPNLVTDYVDVEESLDDRLNGLYNDALVYHNVLNSFDGNDNSDLAKDIRIFRDLTTSLDDEHKKVFIESLDNLRDSISISLVSGTTYEEVVLIIRQELQNILEMFNDIKIRLAKYKNVLNDLNCSLAVLEHKIDNPNEGVIESLVSEILESLKDSNISSDTKMIAYNKLQTILKDWKRKLINDNDGVELVKTIRESAIGQSCEVVSEVTGMGHFWHHLRIGGASWVHSNDDILVITFSILSEICSVKSFIEQYIAKKESFDELLRTLKQTTSDN